MFSREECAQDRPTRAGVAQLVEQLIRNQQVLGSSPSAGSIFLSQSIDSTDAGIVADPIDPLADPLSRTEYRIHVSGGPRRGLLHEVGVQVGRGADLGVAEPHRDLHELDARGNQ
jgi:hypothetical protein